MIYQIQTKFRDEPRSRGGLIRVREFTMKDAYSFHTSQEDLEEYYYKVHEAYDRIYRRIGLKNFISVKSDTGMMGGSVAHEFMALNENGEDELVLCDECGYKSNQEVAECVYASIKPEEMLPLEEIDTGKVKEISEVCNLLKISPEKTVKAVVFAIKGETGTVACFVRGDKDVNEAKLKKVCKKDIVAFDASTETDFCAGNIGPINLDVNDCEVYFDLSLKDTFNMVVVANKKDKHLINFNISRDIKNVEFYDLSKVQEGSICSNCKKHKVRLSNGIEIGNIFQLGTKYSKSMQMLVKTKEGNEINPIMGCYGIGVGRNLACVIEENCDDRGIAMPLSIAPYKVHIAPLRLDNEVVKEEAYNIYNALKEFNIETLIDDRDCMPGIKFADADLIGMPIRVVVSPRSLENQEVEIKLRKTGEIIMVNVKDAVSKIVEIINNNKEI